MSTQAADIGNATPPVAIGSLVMFGIPLTEWVLILTAIYTIIMIIKNLPLAVAAVKKLWSDDDV